MIINPKGGGKDVSGLTAVPSDVRAGKTFVGKNAELETGTMQQYSSWPTVNISLDTSNGRISSSYTMNTGYYIATATTVTSGNCDIPQYDGSYTAIPGGTLSTSGKWLSDDIKIPPTKTMNNIVKKTINFTVPNATNVDFPISAGDFDGSLPWLLWSTDSRNIEGVKFICPYYAVAVLPKYAYTSAGYIRHAPIACASYVNWLATPSKLTINLSNTTFYFAESRGTSSNGNTVDSLTGKVKFMPRTYTFTYWGIQ